jgi:hypothetical protein
MSHGITSDTAITLMREELKKFRTKPDYRIKNELAVRCMFCGDSKKDERDMHLYMRLAPNEDGLALFPFNCKLCGEKRRIFSIQDIKTFEITNEQLIAYITYNCRNQGNIVSSAQYNYIAKELKSAPITCDIEAKKSYLYKRLGNTDICNDPFKYKVILDLVSFFKINALQPNETDYKNAKSLLRRLHEHCIGFVSFDNTHINFREIDGKIGTRYMQYKIYPEKSIDKGTSTSGFYTIPGSLDTMGSPLTLVAAEGTFDILRVYFDYYKNKPLHNTVFMSVANANGYVPCIEKFLEYGIMFDNIHIYSDNDVALDTYRHTIIPIVPDANITIHMNAAYKDFGDIQQPIEEVVTTFF